MLRPARRGILLGDRQGQLPEQRQRGGNGSSGRLQESGERVHLFVPLVAAVHDLDRHRPVRGEFDDFVPRDSDQLPQCLDVADLPHVAAALFGDLRCQRLHRDRFGSYGQLGLFGPRTGRHLSGRGPGSACAVLFRTGALVRQCRADDFDGRFAQEGRRLRAVRRGGCLRLYRRGPEIRRRGASLGR